MARCQTKDYREKLESLYSHTVPLIDSKDLTKEITQGKSIVLLDTRSGAEYKVSHIEGAKKIEFDDFEIKDVEDIPKKSSLVVYCSVGYRSEKIGEQLLKLGYTDVRNLYGGIFQWKNEGFKIVNENKMETDSVHTYNESWSVWLENGIKVY